MRRRTSARQWDGGVNFALSWGAEGSCYRHYARVPDNLPDGGIVFQLMRFEPEFAGHVEHVPVFNVNEPDDLLDAFGARVIQQRVHKLPAKPMPLQVRSDENAEFASRPIRVQNEAGYAKQLLRVVLDRDKGHLSRVVDLGQTGQERVRERTPGREEAQADIVR